MNKAIVLKSISGISTIKNILTLEEFSAELKGNLLKEKSSIFPGDYVEYTCDGSITLINYIYPRKNSLNRPRISNIDYLIIVQSVVEPNINIRMINKYILYFQSQMIDNIILYFTKMDIIKKDQKKYEEIIDHFKKDNFTCFNSNDIIDFFDFLNNESDKVICFSGQSGVGKSTLLNKIDTKYNIKTNEISKALNRGKHTTTTTSLLKYKNGYLVDTPGFSSINLNMNEQEIAIGYTDFRMYSTNCKYNNCLHNTEDNCDIKKKVESNIISKKRYEDYLYFLEQAKNTY